MRRLRNSKAVTGLAAGACSAFAFRNYASAAVPLAPPKSAAVVGQVTREIDARGFRADIFDVHHQDSPTTLKYVHKALSGNNCMLFCGSPGTGKMTILKAIGNALRSKGKEVAFGSFDARRAHIIDGVLVHHLLGLRVNSDELPIQEQMEGTFERHVRLVDSVYENAVHSIATCDVLVVDSLHLAPPVILKSLDAVCRRVRGKPKDPFGGLRIIAAADFWAMPVHPGSDTGGYIFQLPEWDEMFPEQYYLDRVHGQDEELSRVADAALMGELTAEDIKLLQRSSGNHHTHASSGAPATSQGFTPITDTSKGMLQFLPRFPKQPFTLHNPPKAVQIKRVEIGNFLINLLYQSAFAERYGMIGKLSLDVGSKAHLIYPLLKHEDGKHSKSPAASSNSIIDIPAGEPGEVVQISEHRITMSFPAMHRTVDIPRMRVTLRHTQYPELTYATEQFPIFPRAVLMPNLVIQQGGIRKISVDCRSLADTNDLGNILVRMKSWNDFRMTNVRDFLKLESTVHEPTRIYYCKIRKQPVSCNSELWCKNCKGHVSTADFHEHWAQCIRSVRWCPECDKTVELGKLEAHMEKHQVVLCIDCGQAIEWKYWESHRLNCGPMMRELSTENEFLPDVTRRVAIELGLDKRDLHTVKALSRAMLPKSKKDVYGRV